MEVEVEESEMLNEEEAKSTGCKLVRVSCCLLSWLSPSSICCVKSHRSKILAETLASALRHNWMVASLRSDKPSMNQTKQSTPTARYPISCQLQSFTGDLVTGAKRFSDSMAKLGTCGSKAHPVQQCQFSLSYPRESHFD